MSGSSLAPLPLSRGSLEQGPPGGISVLVLQHHKENPRKCTLTPLEGRPGLEVRVLRPRGGVWPTCEVDGGILLAVDAPLLLPGDRALLEAPGARLVLLDSNWIKVPLLLRALRPRGPLARRSLPAGIRTAYPRRSKLHRDPPGGLATVEALAAALRILGAWDPGLLAGYPWAARFLEENRELFGGPPAPSSGLE